MQRVGCWFLAAGMFVAAGQVWAQDPKLDTTAELVDYCDNEGPVGEVRDGQNFCDGFIAGTGLFYFELVAAKKDSAARLRRSDPDPGRGPHSFRRLGGGELGAYGEQADRRFLARHGRRLSVPEMSRAANGGPQMRKTSIILATSRLAAAGWRAARSTRRPARAPAPALPSAPPPVRRSACCRATSWPAP